MGIMSLAAEGVRNLQPFELTPGAGINVVVGANAAGKTSLLEAIYFVARTRSFRATRTAQMIGNGHEALWVRAQTQGHTIGVARDSQETQVRLDGRDGRSLSELARYLPVQVINSEHQRLLLDGPAVRRSFLNWAVFHVEPQFSTVWGRYLRALRQRNAALKAGESRLAWAYDEGLIETADTIDRHRRHLIDALEPRWSALVRRWLPDEPVALHYRPGWRSDEPLADRLEAQRELDRQRGFTNSGPHRADLSFRVAGVEAQHRLSRGQQKLLVLALLLAQAAVTHTLTGQSLTLLVDDLAAELDPARRAAVVEAIASSGNQAFLTAIEPGDIPLAPDAAQWFHVEQGRIHSGPPPAAG